MTYPEEPDDDRDLGEVCEECNYLIPDAEEGSVCNRYHATYCSLYNPDND